MTEWLFVLTLFAGSMLMLAELLEPFTREPLRFRTRLRISLYGFGIAGGLMLAWRIG